MTPDGVVRLVLLPQLAFYKGEKPGESCESATEDHVHGTPQLSYFLSLCL